VFLWEGIMKFVFANQGIGRFTKLGFPFPGPTADLMAVIEIVGGLLMQRVRKTFAELQILEFESYPDSTEDSETTMPPALTTFFTRLQAAGVQPASGLALTA